MPAHQLTDLDDLLTGPLAAPGGTPGWWQPYVDFPDWPASESAAARHLAPLLRQAQAEGLVTGWWFIRKNPCWRLRLRPGPDAPATRAFIRVALDKLVADGAIRRWWPGVYEAEEAAFGGPGGMAAAHDLFTADSDAVMNLLRGSQEGTGLGRRELSVVLCTALLRGARLEWYEQGDAWHRVTRERPLPADVTVGHVDALADSIKVLLTVGTSPASDLFGAGGPLAGAAEWAAAFRQAGQDLGGLARSGTLQRGLREVLSYHVIFHWNRLGITARHQAILSRAARDAILGPRPPGAYLYQAGAPARRPRIPRRRSNDPGACEKKGDDHCDR